MSQDPVISLENVSVRYRVPRERVSGIKEFAVRWAQRRLQYEDFWALRGVSVDVRHGEVFGVIGRNGSGKSTLLKVIARVLYPTQGRLVLRNKVVPLLELGAGFHPELTGRENVFLNSALLGRTRRQVEQLLPEIIEFAEIPDFIDAPIRTYSTGMVTRLGFAVATCLRPEILLVDEVLSVGDAPFQQKCLDRMYSYQAQGTTIVIVSHSMATIQTFCERALWLNHGVPEIVGPVDQVIERYMHMDRPATEKAPSAASSAAKVKTPLPLPEPGKLYPADGALDIQHGAFTAWIKFHGDRPFRDCVIFHTDDSRYILYIGSYLDEETQQTTRLLIARAGGNQRALDTYFGTTSFPEVFVTVDPQGEHGVDVWRHVAITWEGHPAGRLCLYVDGKLAAEREYDGRFDNGHPLPQTMALGLRPPQWAGELIEQEDGTIVDARPESTLSIADSNLEIRGARLYRAALSQEEILLFTRHAAEQ